MPRRLSVLDRSGDHVMWVDESEARELIKFGQVELLWSKKRVRFLRITDQSVRAADLKPGHARPAKYSHNHEVAETYIGDDGRLHARNKLDANPRGVWTLKRIPDKLRTIFTEVLEGCQQKPAA